MLAKSQNKEKGIGNKWIYTKLVIMGYNLGAKCGVTPCTDYL